MTDLDLARVRARIVQIRAERNDRRDRIPPAPPPRYDAVFFEGVAWLDRLAGTPYEDLPEEADE